ncbi:hypothetical protein MGYG_05798 [Nannizzia gypsea CBS 118893]|uniref:Uncharacterized protein n=1 Tax=Arthroderma gypseum (strain ATCC MYA-4604 / CBS 118893) TaxID=535722 RepID=E4UXW6_ARTGP|nr:hypothetical protein MGYG_05798 [Nannizzia gypsea CBS 118893]EFR02798.1 hypothetical protein MGYG_05798 [Nannizzia gypsea CBS 118893]
MIEQERQGNSLSTSSIVSLQDWYKAQKTDNYEYDRLLEIVKHDLESLEFNIYHTWMKGLKKKLFKMGSYVPGKIRVRTRLLTKEDGKPPSNTNNLKKLNLDGR